MNPVGTWTLFKRETMRFAKVYLQTIFAPVISNLLFFAVFGLSLRKTIVEVQGVGYLEFLVPGLIIMGIITNAYQNPSSSIIIMKYQGLISDLLTIPLNRAEIMLAMISSAILRSLIIGFMTYLSSLYFVDFTYNSIPIIIITAFLVSIFFSLLGLFIGIWANEFDRTAFIQNFVMQPLIFFGGVFFSIRSLPEIFQKISALNPIVYMINLLRYGFTGIADFPIELSLYIVSASTILLGITTYLVFRSGWRLQT